MKESNQIPIKYTQNFLTDSDGFYLFWFSIQSRMDYRKSSNGLMGQLSVLFVNFFNKFFF